MRKIIYETAELSHFYYFIILLLIAGWFWRSLKKERYDGIIFPVIGMYRRMHSREKQVYSIRNNTML